MLDKQRGTRGHDRQICCPKQGVYNVFPAPLSLPAHAVSKSVAFEIGACYPEREREREIRLWGVYLDALYNS